MTTIKTEIDIIGVAQYALPIFQLTPQGLKKTEDFSVLHFVKGEQKGNVVEQLLALANIRLNNLNLELPCIETEMARQHVVEALNWLQKRDIDRKERNVTNTKQL